MHPLVRVRVSLLAIALLLGASASRAQSQATPSLYRWVGADSPPTNVVRGPDDLRPAVCRANSPRGLPLVGGYVDGNCHIWGGDDVGISRVNLQFLVSAAGTPVWTRVGPTSQGAEVNVGNGTPNLVSTAVETYGYGSTRPSQFVCSYLGLVGMVPNAIQSYCEIPVTWDSLRVLQTPWVKANMHAVVLIGKIDSTNASWYQWVPGTTPPSNVVTAEEGRRTAVCRAAAPDGTVTPGFWSNGACQLLFNYRAVSSSQSLGFLVSVWKAPDWRRGSTNNMTPDASMRVGGVHDMIEGGKDAKGNPLYVCMRGSFAGYLMPDPQQASRCNTAAGWQGGMPSDPSPGARAKALSGMLY